MMQHVGRLDDVGGQRGLGLLVGHRQARRAFRLARRQRPGDLDGGRPAGAGPAVAGRGRAVLSAFVLSARLVLNLIRGLHDPRRRRVGPRIVRDGAAGRVRRRGPRRRQYGGRPLLQPARAIAVVSGAGAGAGAGLFAADAAGGRFPG